VTPAMLRSLLNSCIITIIVNEQSQALHKEQPAKAHPDLGSPAIRLPNSPSI